MGNRISKYENVAKINGKYTLYVALISALVAIIGYFFKCQGAESKHQEENNKDSINKTVEIKNNSINQSNASNSNAQIGSENKSE